jgi:SAM-dependent methyltransferase
MTDRANEYRFGYSVKELERLGNQHNVWAEDNRRLLARAGFDVGDTIVDLGCGPGYTTLDLASLVGPEGKVIGVDRDEESSLSMLKAKAEASGLSNIETRACELEALDLTEESVDGVYGRWVLMYLPEGQVKPLVFRIAKWLRPRGVCALSEFCNYRHIHIHPPTIHLPAVAEALIHAVTGNRGCNPQIGNRLPGLLHTAGLTVELNVVTKVVQATTPEWKWPDALFRDILPRLVREGYLSQTVLDAFLKDWALRSLDTEAIFFGSPVMETVGRRP